VQTKEKIIYNLEATENKKTFEELKCDDVEIEKYEKC